MSTTVARAKVAEVLTRVVGEVGVGQVHVKRIDHCLGERIRAGFGKLLKEPPHRGREQVLVEGDGNASVVVDDHWHIGCRSNLHRPNP